MANHGTPRLAFVEPSSGSMTTMSAPDGPVMPLSSDSTAYPASWSRATATSSVTTSTAYWPSRIPDGTPLRRDPQLGLHGVGDSWNSGKAG